MYPLNGTYASVHTYVEIYTFLEFWDILLESFFF